MLGSHPTCLQSGPIPTLRHPCCHHLPIASAIPWNRLVITNRQSFCAGNGPTSTGGAGGWFEDEAVGRAKHSSSHEDPRLQEVLLLPCSSFSGLPARIEKAQKAAPALHLSLLKASSWLQHFHSDSQAGGQVPTAVAASGNYGSWHHGVKLYGKFSPAQHSQDGSRHLLGGHGEGKPCCLRKSDLVSPNTFCFTACGIKRLSLHPPECLCAEDALNMETSSFGLSI